MNDVVIDLPDVVSSLARVTCVLVMTCGAVGASVNARQAPRCCDGNKHVWAFSCWACSHAARCGTAAAAGQRKNLS